MCSSKLHKHHKKMQTFFFFSPLPMASRLSIFPPISIFKSLKLPFSLIYRLKRLHVCTKFDFPGCLLPSKSILELDISEVREREGEKHPILENKTRSEESNEKERCRNFSRETQEKGQMG